MKFPLPFSLTRAQAALVVLLAGWATIRWYGARVTDGSDEPLGLLALGASLWFAPRAGWRLPLSAKRVGLACGLMGGFALGQFFDWPPLLRAAVWLGAVAAVVAPARSLVAWSGLLALSLPIIASLQFYLGYPIRVAVTWTAAGLLRLGGFHVVPEATMLNWAGERVLIDAPCSGLQMAWTMSGLVLVVAASRALDGRRTLALLRFGAAVVWGTNVVRAAAIFILEMSFHVSDPWVHDAVGLTLFALAAAAVLWRGECSLADHSRVARGEMPAVVSQ